MEDDGDEGTILMLIMMVGVMITVMEVKMNVMTESRLAVLSVLLISHPSIFYSHLSCAGSPEG